MKNILLFRDWVARLARALPACGLEADWDEMVVIHYAFEPAELQPYVPFPLDLHEGKAHVSLVSFELNRMRPNKTGRLGRWLFRPISDHLFLNVRTYVRGPQGPGIYFIREWINNPLSRLLGPRSYGLPYHCAPMRRIERNGGTMQIEVGDAKSDALEILIPTRRNPARAAAPGTLAEFLVERYVAYTEHHGVNRYFRVAHHCWEAEDLDWMRLETGLLEKTFPWFERGKLCGGHRTIGFKNVFMSRPFRCAAASTSPSKGSSAEKACTGSAGASPAPSLRLC